VKAGEVLPPDRHDFEVCRRRRGCRGPGHAAHARILARVTPLRRRAV